MKVSIFYLFPIIISVFFLVLFFSPEVAKTFGGVADLSNFFIVLLTYVYVVLTGMMVRKMIESQKQERRPYVIFDLKFNGPIVYAVVQNIGKMPAKNIEISITPELPTLKNEDKLSETIFNKPILFFPPGKELKTFFNISKELFSVENPNEYQVKLMYNWDGQNEKAVELHQINIDHEKHIYRTNEKDIKDIFKEFSKMNEILAKIENNMSSTNSTDFGNIPRFQ